MKPRGQIVIKTKFGGIRWKILKVQETKVIIIPKVRGASANIKKAMSFIASSDFPQVGPTFHVSKYNSLLSLKLKNL